MPNRHHVFAAFLLAGNIVAAVAYGQSVQVNKVTDFATSFEKLALLPTIGPSGFDTIWLDALLAEKFSRRGLTIMPVPAVRQRMFDLGLKQLTDENRKALASDLGVDAFVAASVDAVATENAGSVGVVVWPGIFSSIPADRNTGSVQLLIISAGSGKTLMEGTAHAQSEVRSKRGVIGRSFDVILDRILTPQFFAQRKTKDTH